ncbi:conserved hypothetical protein [Culex quinquefasciatus]|uniref:CCHC-type domain-containing protein n=1 Tax=Culex quinquefasciatus TaxID=7176 RepID=B0WBS7_CULQU|nr:conserved hypothetical protein [Culex quinquefasciatus]|eukprot:XP_001846161.1 conserved hypothetical protein [Culex quinquefasciatus]
MDLNQLIALYHGMDTAHLPIDELDHELRTRSMSDAASRSQKEQALRVRLKEEKIVRAAELALVNENLTKLLREEVVSEEGQIENEKGTGDGNKVQHNATKERLLAANKELITVVHQLMNQIQMLEATQKEKDKPCKTTNSTQIAERVPKNSGDGKPKPNDFFDWLKQKGSVETSLNESEGTESNDKPNVNGASTHRELTVNKRLPVHKWAIHYDGMDNGRKLNEFLKEVEFNARSEHFSEDELFLSAHHLFTHKARAWFMEVNGNNELGSWRRLVEELKAEFLPVDMDYVYERQASNRKQGAREKFQDFYLDMVRIFRNMSSPWDDKRKFEVLFRNTREECQIAMLAANISDIPKMKEFCKKFDAINGNMFRQKKERFSSNLVRIDEIKEQHQHFHNNNRQFFQQKQNNSGGIRHQNRNQDKPKQETEKREQNESSQESREHQNREEPRREYRPEQETKQTQRSSVSVLSGIKALQRIVNAYIPVKRGVCYNCHEPGHGFADCPMELGNGNDYNAKLGPQYVPCVIVAKKGTSSYEVADMNGKSLGVFSAGDLKA